MRPLEFCLENAIELLPDDLRRRLGAEAREAAEKGQKPRDDFSQECATYFDGVIAEHKRIFWLDAYDKRKARMARMENMKGATV